MSAYDNKYWSHRIAQLAEKVPETDDLSFFASEAYRDFTEQGVKDLICGTCTYLRTLGYDITKEQEEERINDMVVMMSTDENMTACTNGDSMIIGVNNSLVKYFPNRELRHYAIQGLRVHETAHVLFTDFKTIDMWLGALRNGNWWPVVPDHAQDPDGAELTQVLSKKEFSKSFAAIAGRLENAIEDGNGKSVGSMTAEQLSEALKEAVKQIEQAAKNVGVNNLPDRHSNSITNQASKSKDAKKRESGKQGSGNNANGNGNGNSNSIANAPGANSGKSDLSAAKCDIKAIEKARKQEIATAQANNEANNQLAQEGAKIGSEIGTKISVRRAAEVPQSNIDTYNRLSAGLLSVTKNLERRLKTTIRDEENDDAVAGLPMGSRVEARLAYHQDGKIFSRKNFPRDNPRLAVGYLCDESGSMSDEAIAASVRTAIILQDLCERMELPCYVCGFTTGGYSGSVDIITYVDKNVDGKDKYRTTGMASRGGTPTVPAMKYMGKKLMKDSTEKKILIVSTDGCSGRGYGETVRDVIKKLQHDGVMVIGAGIGDSKPRIQEEFGSNFLDISNLDAMPKILCNIVKKNLV